MGRYKTSRRQRWRMTLQQWIMTSGYPATRRKIKILDLGIEYGHSGRMMRKIFPKALIDGVEIHKPTLTACKQDCSKIYKSFHNMDMIEFLENASKRRWDIILAAEVIEHLPKSRGFRLLELLQTHSDLAIVTSPIGFIPHDPLDGNPYQEHVSGWEPAELNELGFRTFMLMPVGFPMGVYFYSRKGIL